MQAQGSSLCVWSSRKTAAACHAWPATQCSVRQPQAAVKTPSDKRLSCNQRMLCPRSPSRVTSGCCHSRRCAAPASQLPASPPKSKFTLDIHQEPLEALLVHPEAALPQAHASCGSYSHSHTAIWPQPMVAKPGCITARAPTALRWLQRVQPQPPSGPAGLARPGHTSIKPRTKLSMLPRPCCTVQIACWYSCATAVQLPASAAGAPLRAGQQLGRWHRQSPHPGSKPSHKLPWPRPAEPQHHETRPKHQREAGGATSQAKLHSSHGAMLTQGTTHMQASKHARPQGRSAMGPRHT